MTQIEQLRKGIIQQTGLIGSRQRFGLFSQPVTLAVGDDGQYKKIVHPRDQHGKPLTKPRNIQVSPNKQGQVNSSFFQPLASLATSTVGDPYIDPARRVLLNQRQIFLKGKNHQINFIPSSGRKTLVNSAYNYLQEKQILKNPKSHRNSEGRVIIHPRNPVTNPMEKVDRTYFKFPSHMQQPYGRQMLIENEERKQAKLKQHQHAFKSMIYSPREFNKSIQIYGQDTKIEKKRSTQTKFNILKHQVPFKYPNPNKQGLYGYFNPFPEYMANPIKEKIRNKEGQKQKKGEFKRMVAQVSRPTPSISLNATNMRKYISNSMSHR